MSTCKAFYQGSIFVGALSMELFDKNLLIRIGKYLKKKEETIAVAESVTSGMLQYAFSNIPDATDFFQGGLTAYNIAQKYKHLQVEPIHALSVNCVSPLVAEQMAIEVCRIFGAHWGIGITGYATPVPESGNKLFAYFAITYKEKVRLKGMLRSEEKHPPDVQLQYTKTVLQKLATVTK